MWRSRWPDTGMMLPNPWQTVTAEELLEKSGFSFTVPEGADNVIYRWMEEGKMAEMQFISGNDEFCARIQPAALQAGELMNISGIYYEWEHEESATVGHCEGTIGQAKTGSKEWVELCLWYDMAPGLMYSLSAHIPNDPDGFDLVAVAEQVFIPAQGND